MALVLATRWGIIKQIKDIPKRLQSCNPRNVNPLLPAMSIAYFRTCRSLKDTNDIPLMRPTVNNSSSSLNVSQLNHDVETGCSASAVPVDCESTLNQSVPKEEDVTTPKKKVPPSPMFPIPTAEQVAKVSSVLSIAINGNTVSWCHIERSENKSAFIVQSLVQKSMVYKPKMHFLNVLNDMTSIASQLPNAQLFVIEEYSNALPNPHMFAYQLQLSQSRSFFIGSLATLRNVSQIMSIKTAAVARSFDTYVGSERVSGQHVVDNMITWKPSPSLVFSRAIKSRYELSDSKSKECLSSVLLLNLAYWKLTKQFI